MRKTKVKGKEATKKKDGGKGKGGEEDKEKKEGGTEERGGRKERTNKPGVKGRDKLWGNTTGTQTARACGQPKRQNHVPVCCSRRDH